MLEAPLWNHQKETIEAAKDKVSFGLFHDAGVGKTRTMIEIYRQKCANNKRLLRTLIVSPTVTLNNWKNEIVKYSKITSDEIVVLAGTGAERARNFEWAIGVDKTPKIFICNYESLLMDKLYEQFDKYGFECIIADESHRIKSHNSKRTKALINLSIDVKYRFIMSGTPVLKSPLDLFTQFKFLDQGETFHPCGTNFYAFQRQFFYDKNAGAPAHVTWPNFQLRPGAVDEISSKIKRITTHYKKSECLDLPPMVRKTVPVVMSREQAGHYNMMKNNFITTLGDKACTAQLAITKALRLQQIVSGFIALEDGSVVQLKDNPRLTALEDLLEDLVVAGDKKVIIWACWRENYKQIAEILQKKKIKYVEAHGEVATNKRQAAIDSFCKDEDVKVIIGNQGALGIGINLVQASYAIYYSRNFSLEHDIQSEARNYRGGSEIHESITRIDLVAQGTIDDIILQALASKQEIGDKLLRDMAKDL